MTQFYSGMKGPVAIDKLNELWTAADTIITGSANTAVDAAAAAASAAAAAISATNASTSASTATTQANTATTQATTASTQATTATTKATQANTSATAAATSATAASGSAAAAATSATNAGNSATAAANSATAASTSATTATTKAGEASTSATNASTSATTATTKAAEAVASATSAALSYDQFDNRYLGPKAVAPTLDNKSAALITGAMYFNSTDKNTYVYDTTLGWGSVSNTATSIAAQISANSAALDASQAESSSQSALSSKNLAKDWAEKLTEVETGKFSAKYWAQQAASTVTGTLVYRGAFDAGSGAYPSALGTGDYYRVSVAGAIGTIHYEVGDTIVYNGTSWDKNNDADDNVLGVRNTSGATITTTKAVYFSGSSGNKMLITLADNTTELASSKTMGLTLGDITNNADGFIATGGIVANITTTGLTEGGTIWLGTSGTLTSTKPVAPAHTVLVGFCIRTHATNGIIYLKLQNGYEIEELHNVLITSLSNNQILQYDSASSLWKNTTVSPALVGLGSVDNTSDLAKPISTATQTALNAKANLASPTFTGTVSGITKAMVGLGSVDNTSDLAKPISSATQTALNAKADLASPTFTGTVSGITKAMVGLGSVDNTSDLAKPISTTTQTALNAKADSANTTLTGTTTATVVKFTEFNAGSSSTAITVNFTNGQKQKLTLTANTTITLSFPGAGNYQILLVQDATGSRTVTWAGVPNYIGSATAPAINSTINSRTIVSIYYDGTNYFLAAAKVGA